MGESIRKNEDIQGIKVSNSRKTCSVKLSQYADDTTAFLKNQPGSLQKHFDLLHKFGLSSGFKANENKTKIACIGNNRKSEQKKMVNIFPNLLWVDEKLDILGIEIPVKSDMKKQQQWSGIA